MPGQVDNTGSRVRLSAPRFVGRASARQTVQDALSTPPAVVLVEGEAGIGKSRLVQECLPDAGEPAAGVLVGGCPPHREPATLAPIVDALRGAGDRLPALRLTPLAGALRPLFPEWAARLPGPPEPLADPKAARYRLFRALAELIERLDAGVLVVEDLHWADEVSLEFLLFLATRQGSPHKLGLVATYRPEDLPGGSLVRRLSSRAPAGTTQARVVLPSLTLDHTAELAASMLGGEPVSPPLAALLHEQTGGVPLAVEESVRLLADRADLTRQHGSWVRRRPGRLEVPPTVRDATLERAGRLGPAARRVLRAAAVLADPADEAALVAVAGLPAAAGRAGVAAAVASGLLRETRGRSGSPGGGPGPVGGGWLAFRHALVATAVYEAIPAQQRRRLHLRAGRLLETAGARAGGAAGRPAARQLARHFRAAGQTDKWLRYAELAATDAVAASDHATAVELLVGLLDHPAPPAPARFRLARAAGTAAQSIQAFAGDQRQQAVQALRRSLDVPGLAAGQRAELGNLLGRLLNQLGETGAGFAELARAIPQLTDRLEAARSMNLLGWPRAGPWPAATHLGWLRRAAALPLPGCSQADRIGLLVDRAAALLQLGSAAGWRLVDQLPDRADGAEQRYHLARGHLNVGDAALLWGRYAEARRLLSRARELAEAGQLARVRDCVLANLIYLDWVTGSWAGLDGQIAVLRDTDGVEAGARQKSLLVLGLLQAARGAPDAAGEQLRGLTDQVRHQGAVSRELAPAAGLARLWLAAGDHDLALALTEVPIRTVTRKRIWVWATDLAPVRVEALARTGSGPAAQRLVHDFANGLQGRDAPGPRAALAACRAILAEHRGEFEQAAAGFDRAARAWQALPRPYEALLARERRAGCLFAAGQAEAAAAELREVYDRLCELGAAGDADRVATRLGLPATGRSGRQRRHGRRGYGDQLSPRELEVVQLVATGMTNRQIGQALSKAPGTIAQQLQSAMRKLGVSTRTAVAVAALRAAGSPADAGRSATVQEVD